MRVSQVLSLLMILLFGLLLLFVALTPVYDSFMHPRFRPLTLLGGYFMMALGIFSAGKRIAPLRPVQLLVVLGAFAVMLSAVIVQYPQKSNLAALAEDTVVEAGTSDDLSPPFEDGAYVRISIPELFLLTLDKKEDSLGMPVMLRGVALRREDLDKKNRIALGRVFLSCCAADSVRLIFFVDVPEGFDKSLIKDSSWVVIKGQVSALKAEGTSLPNADGLSPDSFSTMDIVSTEYILKADEITATREPTIFFTDTLRNEEPYTF